MITHVNKKTPLQQCIDNRIKHNQNFMCVITGATGSGKTYAALSLAQKRDPNFSVDNVVFTPKEFLNLLNSGKLKKGSVIIADEFGVSMNSRDWQSTSNKILNYVMQTFRSKNYVVYFTAPDFAFIDSAARKMFHAHFSTMGINRKRKCVRIKPFFLQVNQKTGDIYYKYLKFTMKQTQTKTLTEIMVSKPSKELIDAYEIKKDEYVNNLNKQLEEELLAKENKEVKKDKIQVFEEHQYALITNKRAEGMTWKDIAHDIGKSSADNARVYYNSLKKKYANTGEELDLGERNNSEVHI